MALNIVIVAGSDLQCPAGISTKTTYTWLEAKNRGAKEYMRVLQSRKQELQNLDLTDAFVERAEYVVPLLLETLSVISKRQLVRHK